MSKSVRASIDQATWYMRGSLQSEKLQQSRYSIGIDLGTTNCAVAYCDLNEPSSSSVTLLIPQRDEANTEVRHSALPSYLAWEDQKWIAGEYAQKLSREKPDAVVHSAKSWLCHHGVEAEAKILPWKSTAVSDADKLSPIEASARLLGSIKNAWEREMGFQASFGEQWITITVPASFDAAAQACTLKAARLAGYPESLRLLEEPQAAFYQYLETTEEMEGQGGHHVLVVDIGGGTSDFSLFQLGEANAGKPIIKRIAVSDHLLLGGDNIDLALAHALESELAPKGEELSVDQWAHVLSRARSLKERCLDQLDTKDELAHVSIPSSGAGLFAGTLSTEISLLQARELLMEGFFPLCSKDAEIERVDSGLLEWGLPYATDCAVTRHLANFVRGKPKINSVLFNGGTCQPQIVRHRIIEQIGVWQEGELPRELASSNLSLSVSKGAAYFGALSCRGDRKIQANAARGLYIETAGSEGTLLVCIVPKGASPERKFRIEVPGMRMNLNLRSQFRVAQGPDEREDGAGAVMSREDRADFRALPPLEAKVEWEDPELESIPVRLVSCLRETGILEVSCEALGHGEGVAWPLAFNLRNASEVSTKGDIRGEGTNVRLELEASLSRNLERALGNVLAAGRGSPKRVLADLEKAARQPKQDWNAALSRFLADCCLNFEPSCDRPEAAERWLQLTGYFLRPGFGFKGDADRMALLMQRLSEWGEERVALRVELQWLILLRRVASGLSETEQVSLFVEQAEKWRSTDKASAERLRLLGTFERMDPQRKLDFIHELIDCLDKEVLKEGYVAPYLAALEGLARRILYRAGPDKVLPAEGVASIYKCLSRCDWSDPRFADVIPLFLSAARISDDRALNLPSKLQKRIVRKLEKSGVASNRLTPLFEFIPLSRGEAAQIIGEALPLGLSLR